MDMIEKSNFPQIFRVLREISSKLPPLSPDQFSAPVLPTPGLRRLYGQHHRSAIAIERESYCFGGKRAAGSWVAANPRSRDS
nr:hypothetical protein Iba_chr14fCG10320 [Ipomoea batatas]